MIQFKKYINGKLCQATPIYDGFYNDTTFTMKFKDTVWFNQEIKNIGLLSHKSYTPEITSINISNKEISFKWYNSNLNHIFNFQSSLPDDWQKQIKDILEDMESMGIYKLNVYPHTFYVNQSKICIMDLHACAAYNDVVEHSVMEPIINDKKRFKFVNGILDIKGTYEYTIKNNIGDWPEDFLNA
jgi:hypothetical protein